MGLTQKFSLSTINRQIRNGVEGKKALTLKKLLEIGKDAVRNSRDVGAYTDRTRNLRSSNFFIILQDGERMHEDFQEHGTGPEGPAGVERAKQFADEIQRGYEGYSGFVLILGSGMQYAAEVESRGYDVLTSTGYETEDQLRAAIKQMMNG